MPLHFVSASASAARPGDEIALTGAEAHHAATVRRVRAGEEVSVGDGLGVWLTGSCVTAAPKEVVVAVAERREIAAPSPRVILVQALAKGDRDELAVQAATELGVDEIVPWQAVRSVSRWSNEKAEKGRARWEAIAREAAKQAHRAWLPDVTPVQSTTQLSALADRSRMLVLEPTATAALSGVAVDDGRDIAVVVGPEGGIAPDELSALEAVGATLVRLGDTVLRTSTAGPAAVAVASVALGRW